MARRPILIIASMGLNIYICLCHICIVYVGKCIILGGFDQLMGVAHNRTRAQALYVEQQEESYL